MCLASCRLPQGTAYEAAADVAAFMAIFFEHFTKFKGRPVHMAGESYGVRIPVSLHVCSYLESRLAPQGRYIPAFATQVYDQNAALIAAGLTPINLTSIMLGERLVVRL